MDDQLKVGFGNNNKADYRKTEHSSIKMTSISPRVMKPKRKLKLIRLAAVVAAVGLGSYGAVKLYDYNYNYREVCHDLSGDYIINGEVNHVHDLTEEYFICDYKYYNPNATQQDIVKVLSDGSYTFYAKHNGKVRWDHSVSEDQLNAERYQTECREFTDDFIENHHELGITRTIGHDGGLTH